MKKTPIAFFFLIVIIIMPSYIFAQKSYAIDKGSVNLSGNIEFKFEDLDPNREDWNTALNMNPSFLHFIISNLGIGVVLDYTISEDIASKVGFGPKIAYYFGNEHSKTYPFIGGKFLPIRVKKSINNLPIVRDWKYQISFGVTSMLTKNVGLTCESYYQYEYIKTEGWDLQKSYYLKTFGIQLGFSYFIY